MQPGSADVALLRTIARRTALILLALAALAVAVATVTGGTPDSPACSERFDRRAWAAAVDDATGEPLIPDGEDVRHRLAKQLVRCKLILGRSQAEVWKLLGRPYDGKRGEQDLGDVWLTGVELFVPPDSLALYISYDRRGEVNYVELGQT